MTEVEALVVCKLAPLRTRRDIAMLGLIRRSILGRGPKQLRDLFQLQQREAQLRHTRIAARRHRLQVVEFEGQQDYVRRSIWGLITIYNLLPSYVVEECATVRDFQGALQDLVMQRAIAGCQDWQDTLSPRLPLAGHPLVSLLMG